jgi:hypothetical protein
MVLDKPRRSKYPLKAALGIALCVVVLLVGGTPISSRALAASPCRADPVVILSNGLTIDIYTTLYDDKGLADVGSVAYVLHGPALPATQSPPAGAQPAGNGWYAISYPDGTGPISSFKYVADDSLGTYDVYITATTKTPAVSMTGNIGWALGGGATSLGEAVPGTSGQAVHVHVSGLSSLNLACSARHLAL